MKRFLLGTVAAVLLAGAASAGPVADFETAYRQMYGAYRAALFKTNAGAAEDSAMAIKSLQSQLGALIAQYGQTPPPHYADDPEFAATMTAAADLAAKAAEQIGAGNLAEAHETLEGVRDLFGDMHIRNGIESYSDRMNAYHAEMEHLLAVDLTSLDDATLGDIRERAAVLSYLAADILAVPPAEAAGNEEYAGLSSAFDASVKDLLAAARSGDADQVRAAVQKLKVPYSKLFAKFG